MNSLRTDLVPINRFLKGKQTFRVKIFLKEKKLKIKSFVRFICLNKQYIQAYYTLKDHD